MHGPFSPISSEVGQDTSIDSMSASPLGPPLLGDVGTVLAPPHAVTPSVATTATKRNALRHGHCVTYCIAYSTAWQSYNTCLANTASRADDSKR